MRLKLIGSAVETYGKGCAMYHARGVAQRITQSLNSPTEKVPQKTPAQKTNDWRDRLWSSSAAVNDTTHTPYINIEKNKRDKK